MPGRAERIAPDRLSGSHAAQALARGDLNVLAGVGGRERTAAEFAESLAAGGFRIDCGVRIATGHSVIQASLRRSRGAAG